MNRSLKILKPLNISCDVIISGVLLIMNGTEASIRFNSGFSCLPTPSRTTVATSNVEKFPSNCKF